VSLPDFSDAALVVLGHGTSQDPEAAVPVFRHAAELRGRQCFRQVREAFWNQAPRAEVVLGQLTESRVFITPFFISAGHLSEQVIPAALGYQPASGQNWSRVLWHGSQLRYYCHCAGTHERVTDVLLAHAERALESSPTGCSLSLAEISLFIAGHGTEKNQNSRVAIDRQVERIQERRVYGEVQALFLEQAPRLDACYHLARFRDILVLPFFTADGPHVREDIPVMLGAPKRLVRQRVAGGQPPWVNPTENHGKRLWYASAIGTDPLMADIILDRVTEASRWKPPGK
jgi:sirohydrochlorin cobaltochelatase